MKLTLICGCGAPRSTRGRVCRRCAMLSVRADQTGRKRSGAALANIRAAQVKRRNVKLTPAQAASIRIRVGAGHSQRSVASQLRVSPMTVNKVVHGKTWTSIDAGRWA